VPLLLKACVYAGVLSCGALQVVPRYGQLTVAAMFSSRLGYQSPTSQIMEICGFVGWLTLLDKFNLLRKATMKRVSGGGYGTLLAFTAFMGLSTGLMHFLKESGHEFGQCAFLRNRGARIPDCWPCSKLDLDFPWALGDTLEPQHQREPACS
jgi:hypothetical protein